MHLIYNDSIEILQQVVVVRVVHVVNGENTMLLYARAHKKKLFLDQTGAIFVKKKTREIILDWL